MAGFPTLRRQLRVHLHEDSRAESPGDSDNPWKREQVRPDHTALSVDINLLLTLFRAPGQRCRSRFLLRLCPCQPVLDGFRAGRW